VEAVTLVEFLSARLDEDEAAALAATPDELDREDGITDSWDDPYGEIQNRDSVSFLHIQRWSPKRVLAQVEAKRRIVAECVAILSVKWWEYEDAPDLAHVTLELLALPDADHPDYREEWKP
jgi:hypothetical protein